MSAAQASRTIDDERVRVTTWTFGAGDSTGPHVHEYDYIVVPVTGGTFTVTGPDGVAHDMTQNAGSPYQGRAGTAHSVAVHGAAAVFVEIEIRR